MNLLLIYYYESLIIHIFKPMVWVDCVIRIAFAKSMQHTMKRYKSSGMWSQA